MSGWQVRDLCLGYRGQTVFGPVDADFAAGKLHSLVGPNGAGKSTLLRHLAGILPKISGKTLFYGQELDIIGRRDKARRIAFLPQEREVVWPLGVRDVVMLGRHPHGSSLETASADDWRAVEAAMEATAIGTLADRLISDLSGGEKARVLLARALATEADWLLLDEPVAGLDPRQQFLVMALLKEQVRQGRSIVLVLHDLALAARFADAVLLLDQGRVAVQGSVPEVLTRAHLADVFGIEAALEPQAEGYRLQIHGVMPCMLGENRVR
jgi:iron complex transport system ATP-binding protein